MTQSSTGGVLPQIGRLFASGSSAGMTEGQLLARFVETRDEAAFAALVERFGPMVLGVCRKLLADNHAGEDAFQATFLVLLRRAGSIRDGDLLGNWLYGVTLKIARRARADLARRQSRERGSRAVIGKAASESDAIEFDVGPILHEELARLPENYRKPLVLCFLDGRSHEDAARQLRWPVGTVKGRIARGKDLLRERLGRRGVTITTAAIAAMLAEAATAAVPPVLIDSTVKAAMGVAAGGAIAGACSATAVALSEGVVASMAFSRMKMIASGLLALGTIATGAAVMARQLGPERGRNPGAQEARKPSDPAKSPANAAENPAGAGGDFARMEAARVRLALLRVEVARKKLERARQLYKTSNASLESVFQASREVMLALRGSSIRPSDSIKDAEAFADLAGQNAAAATAKEQQGLAATGTAAEAEILKLEAEIWLEQAKLDVQMPTVLGDPTGSRRDAGALARAVVEPESEDPGRDKTIKEMLNMPISMPFGAETPLDEILKYIRTATATEAIPQGLPVYVEPAGLTYADKTLQSTIAFNMDGVKLKTTLRLMLKQLDLGYYVKDGLLTITAVEAEAFPLWALPPLEREQRILEMKGQGIPNGQGIPIP